jgi:RNA polymerase sigma-70 factor (ECF subfamily)
LPEIELNKRLRSGDEAAFEFLFKNYYSRLIRFTKLFIEDNIYAEDIVQGVFTSLWIKRADIDLEKSVSAYLMKITKNACLDYLKHRIIISKYANDIIKTETQQLYYFDFFGDNSIPGVEDELINSIKKITELMPEKCRIVFCLRWLDGLKNREIAEKLNISVTMVEKQLAKGIGIFKTNYILKNRSAKLQKLYIYL